MLTGTNVIVLPLLDSKLLLHMSDNGFSRSLLSLSAIISGKSLMP